MSSSKTERPQLVCDRPSLLNNIFTTKQTQQLDVFTACTPPNTVHQPIAHYSSWHMMLASIWQLASIASLPHPIKHSQITLPLPKVCSLFNSNAGPRCTYGKNCKFSHTCNFVATFSLRQTVRAGPPTVEDTPLHSLISHSASMPRISSLLAYSGCKPIPIQLALSFHQTPHPYYTIYYLCSSHHLCIYDPSTHRVWQD